MVLGHCDAGREAAAVDIPVSLAVPGADADVVAAREGEGGGLPEALVEGEALEADDGLWAGVEVEHREGKVDAVGL